ncbi:MAG: hypothetical protein IPK00_24235 [Deltaproteobacteria bacterium]|nr:hypothetical protein [Deltaproteobacteria bacterium]
MIWTLDLTLKIRRRSFAIQDACGPVRWGREVFPDGSIRWHLGPVEFSSWPTRTARGGPCVSGQGVNDWGPERLKVGMLLGGRQIVEAGLADEVV